jgi:hypothetical protein
MFLAPEIEKSHRNFPLKMQKCELSKWAKPQEFRLPFGPKPGRNPGFLCELYPAV